MEIKKQGQATKFWILVPQKVSIVLHTLLSKRNRHTKEGKIASTHQTIKKDSTDPALDTRKSGSKESENEYMPYFSRSSREYKG